MTTDHIPDATKMVPEALRLADHLERFRSFPDDLAAAAELRRLHAENEALQADAKRLDWLQNAADARKVELAKSIYKTGYEIGEWPSLRVTVKSGTLRDAIDAAMQGQP